MEILLLFLVVAGIGWFGAWFGIREGYSEGYFDGYSDRDYETLYDEKPGTRYKKEPRP